MPRAVFDTVVFVRALINPHSLWGRVLFQYSEYYRLCLSQPVLLEIIEVLQRPELTTKFRTLPGMNFASVIELLARAESIEITRIPRVSRDVKDDKFLATARAAHADYLVSEDEDLLVLGKYHGTVIIDTLSFLRVLDESVVP